MPNVATWLNVIRNSSTSLSDPPYIAAGNFGPGCRSVLAGKEETKTTTTTMTEEAAFSIPRSYGRIEVEEVLEWGRCWCSRDRR